MSKEMFTFGFDIEYVVARNTGAKLTPVFAHTIVSGTKQHPLPIPDHSGWVHHWDNTFLEIATPVLTHGHDDPYVQHYAEQLISAAQHCVSYEQGYKVMASPTMRVTGEDEDNYPELLVFGCDVDYNAYTGKQNEAPSPEKARGLRTGGGHIHLGFLDPEGAGFDRDNPEHYHAVVKCFDVMFGVPLKMNGLLSDERLALYGRAGAFRYKKDYPGVEYRVPSNMWATTDVPIPEMDLRRVVRAWKLFLDPDFSSLAEDAADYINSPKEMLVKESGQIILQFASKL